MKTLNTRTEAQFLSLYRAGLWDGEVDTDLFEDHLEWKDIIDLAREQAVVGIVADGLTRLSKSVDSSGVPFSIPPAVAMPYVKSMSSIEAENKKINAVLIELSELLSSNGIVPAVIKGQVVAQLYPHPLSRTPGDIDFLIDTEDYEKAKKLIGPLATEVLSDNEETCHWSCMYKGVDIEVHGKVNATINSVSAKNFASWQKQLLETCPRSSVHIEGFGDAVVMPVEFDVIYILLHVMRHFVSSGVGLRQISDWAVLLAKYGKTLDTQRLGEDIEYFHLRNAWQTMASFVVKFLGTPADCIPFYDHSKDEKAVSIWKLVAAFGNFGKRTQLRRRSRHYIIGKAQSLLNHFKHYLRLVKYFPAETLYRSQRMLIEGFANVFKGK